MRNWLRRLYHRLTHGNSCLYCWMNRQTNGYSPMYSGGDKDSPWEARDA